MTCCATLGLKQGERSRTGGHAVFVKAPREQTERKVDKLCQPVAKEQDPDGRKAIEAQNEEAKAECETRAKESASGLVGHAGSRVASHRADRQSALSALRSRMAAPA